LADDLKILSSRAAPPPSVQEVNWVPGKIRKLSELKTGHWVKIMAIQLSDPARSHLYAQGFQENRKARVLHNDHNGRVMLKLNTEIYLLGRLETPYIQVREFVPE